MSHSSVLYGNLSVLSGESALVLTMMLHKYRDRMTDISLFSAR